MRGEVTKGSPREIINYRASNEEWISLSHEVVGMTVHLQLYTLSFWPLAFFADHFQ